MKNVIYFILFVLTSCQLFDPGEHKNDFILAGISDGLQEVTFEPPKIISILNTEPEPDSFKIDLNNDEINDIMFISEGYISHGGMQAVSYVVSLTPNTHIALAADSLCAKKIDYLDTINHHYNWSRKTNLRYTLLHYKNVYPIFEILGEWENDITTYLGIYLKEKESFAYCKITIQGYKDITLYSYAVQK